MGYSALAEDLASHGYVVVAFDAPHRTGTVVFPDGRVATRTAENNPELASGTEWSGTLDRLLAAWTADIGFALDCLRRRNASGAPDRLGGRLDLDRIGVFGCGRQGPVKLAHPRIGP